MRKTAFFEPQAAFKGKALSWAARHPFCMVLDSCETTIDRYGKYEWLIGVNSNEKTPLIDTLSGMGKLFSNSQEEKDDEQALELGSRSEKPWYFGFLSYDLKNQLETRLKTTVPASISLPDISFFEAETVLFQRKGEKKIGIYSVSPEQVRNEIFSEKETESETREEIGNATSFPALQSNFSRDQYLETVQQLRAHIKAGDCYEINLCQEFSAQAKIDHPIALWKKLTRLSPVPFAAFGRFRDSFLLSASPERFLQHQEGKLITQPIKGTLPRGKSPEQDLENRDKLANSAKDQAENVMIVDLARNDLYRSCEINSVEVPFLFEVQSFPKVHHLVSTVTGQLQAGLNPFEAIKNAFPPGSMTGAPKYRVMELIDHYEPSARGIYAGSAGYIDSEGNFDLNVVIRSLVYDQRTGMLSNHVGGAITWDSDPAEEYEETLVKASAVKELLEEHCPD